MQTSVNTQHDLDLDHVQRLARALVGAANEHGRPNSFSPGELFRFHGGPSPMTIGRIASQYPRTLSIALEQAGWTGDPPQYLKTARRFFV